MRVRPDVVPNDRTRRQPAQSHSAIQRSRVRAEPRATGAARPYRRADVTTQVRRPHRTPDHRYARPHHRYVRRSPLVRYDVPVRRSYAVRYTHWWVHPYYRHYRSCSVVVGFPFYVHPWTSWWAPPPRPGWRWVPGYWAVDWWVPGGWRPVRRAPVVRDVTYVWVDGWWQGELYVEGFWRVPARGANWVWVDGRYAEGGVYVRGHWRPIAPEPPGYVWVPGFWDGEVWVGGFWRPRIHEGYVWVPGYFDDDGVYHMGFWEPEVDRPGYVWVPGWFDGTTWVTGQWVSEEDYRSADVEGWEPPEGWDAGWDEDEVVTDEADDAPLALPADDGDDAR